MPDATIASLPASMQTALTWGAGIGAALLPVIAYFKAKGAPSGPKDDKTLAVAMAAPLGDPNQLRLVLEAINRLCGFAEHLLAIAEDLKGEQERTNSALGRNEESNGRVASALRDLDDTLRRRPDRA